MNNEVILCGLIGDPVEHSVSPLLFKYYAKSAGLNNYYHFKFKVDKRVKDELKRTVEGIKAFSMRGYNITLPYKIKIMKYVDILDKQAERIGAVNVILNKNRKILGYNTDGVGFIRSLETSVRNVLSTDKVVIFGAGGASRAICSELYARTKNLVIINRDLKEGLVLKNRLELWGGKGVKLLIFNDVNLKREMLDANIICNTTPVGMFPSNEECLISDETFKYLSNNRKSWKNIIFCDAIFNPYKTKFLVQAEKLGATSLSGVGMMVFQAVEAFNIWTGKRVNTKTIKQAYKLVNLALKNANKKRTG